MVEIRCGACKKTFEAQRRNAKWCSARCRKQGSRVPDAPAVVVTLETGSAVDDDTPFVAMVRRTLAQAERDQTFLGMMAIELAKAALSPRDTGSAKASLMKQLREVMGEALKGTGVTLDAIDELEARRQKKLAGLGA